MDKAKTTEQNECRCAKTSCGCANVTAERCTCGESCACTRTCRCGRGCGCAARG